MTDVDLNKCHGLIIVNTCNGKGKTTVVLGTLFRNLGQGFKVVMVQFIKGGWCYGFRLVDIVLEMLAWKPQRLHVILTGCDAHEKIIEMADLITELREIKYPHQKWVKVQHGIAL
jgi:ATP:corrinoid adenosyltransferase